MATLEVIMPRFLAISISQTFLIVSQNIVPLEARHIDVDQKLRRLAREESVRGFFAQIFQRCCTEVNRTGN